MSAIFGFCSFDNLPQPAIDEQVQKMKNKLKPWAPGGFKTNTAGFACFGIAVGVTRDSDQHLQPPLNIENRFVLFTAAARLDYREDLLSRVDTKNLTKHDTELVREQYLKNRNRTPRLLLGDWAYAAFDSKGKTVELARDPIGNTALYYTVNRSFFAFAPTPHALLAIDGVSGGLDEWKLACEICRFPDPETSDHTKWKDIRQLLPSHQLSANPDNLSVERYWSFNDLPPIRLNSDEEYYEQFRELMSRAVQSRIAGYEKIGTTLSSGFDSGTVTAFAAKQLGQQNRTLTAYTSVPMYKKVANIRESVVDEWPVAHSHTRLYPNIDHVPVAGQKSAPHHILKKLVTKYGETIFTPGNAFWIHAILSQAKADGIQALLTGQMGNAGISWNGNRNQILHQFLGGEWKQGITSVKNFKENVGISWYKVLKYLLFWQLLSPVKRSFKRILNPNDLHWNYPSPINRNLARQLHLNRAIRKSIFSGYEHTLASPVKKRVRILEVNSSITCAAWHRNGAMYNMDVLDPTADLRVLTFCFGIPDELHSKDGNGRLLIKNALKKILPDEVLNYKYKGKQAADIGLRLLDYKEELKSEIEGISGIPAVRKYLDIPILHQSLNQLSPTLTYSKSYQCSSQLLTGLMYGYFLKEYG